jgi:hypothetical protein
MPSSFFFFFRNYDYNYSEIDIYHGYILYKVEIIFLQSLLIMNTIFPPLYETLFVGQLFAEVFELITHAVF